MMRKRRTKASSAYGNPIPVLQGIELALHQVRTPSSFRYDLLENLSLAARHKVTGEPIIGRDYPKDQPFLIALVLGSGAVFLTILFFLLRPRAGGRSRSGRALVAGNP